MTSCYDVYMFFTRRLKRRKLNSITQWRTKFDLKKVHTTLNIPNIGVISAQMSEDQSHHF